MTGGPGRLEQKVAVVTGGGSGIGRAAAVRFAGEGARVLVADIDAGNAGAVAGEISATGGRAAALEVDVSDPAQVEAMAARAVAEFGGIDILMTAAGVLSFGSATETDPAAWSRVIGINLTGTFLAARAVIPAMAQRGGGAMLTKAMAVDHAAQGIRVNAIAPGPTATPMLGSVMTEDEMRRFGEAMPIGRLAQPAELAAAAAFLASDDASYVTGAVFAVDGGQTAKVGMTLADLGTIARQS